MQKKILFLNIILNVFIIFSFRIKLYNTFLLHDINNNRINNQIMNNETLVNVSYYTSLVLCSICNILCITHIILLFVKGYKNTICIISLNICLFYIILNTIDSIPKFDYINTKTPTTFCKLMGCVRINTKGICYTVTFVLFCYSWVILLVGQYKKKLLNRYLKL